MLPTSLLVLLALTSNDAEAFEGHGTFFTPGQGTLTAPRTLWQPWSAPKGAWVADLSFEYAHAPILALYPNTSEPTPYLTRMVVADLAGMYAIHRRFGVAASVPIYGASQSSLVTNDTSVGPDGPGIGDMRIWAPIGVIVPDGEGFGLSVIPELTLPTGNTQLRGQALAGGLVVAAGYDQGFVDLNANVGLRQSTYPRGGDDAATLLLEADTRTQLLVGGSAAVKPDDDLAIVTEVWSQVGLTSDSDNLASPAEAAVTVRWQAIESTTLTIGGASAINGGAGAPRFRVYMGAQWGKRPDDQLEVMDPLEVLKKAEGPYDLVVRVRDERGRAVRAEVAVTDAAGETRVTETDRDGAAVIRLEPGVFEVAIASEGLGTQTRTVDLSEGRYTPPSVDAVLHDEAGDGTLAVVVQDTEDRRVDGASVEVDGEQYGTTGTGGDLVIEGLSDGDHSVQATAADFVTPTAQTLKTGEANNVLVLDRPPGSVQILCRTPDHQVVGDAQVRFLGPAEVEPAEIGLTGKKIFQLEEGTWTVMVSSAEYGVQEREVVVDPLRKVLQQVDVVLTPVVGEAELRLTVLDPDGNPVQGAQVTLDGASYGSTSNGGTLTLTGLEPGARVLDVDGERFVDEEPLDIELVDGVRELLITLDWKPGTLQVVTRGKDERPIDAQVRFDGPQDLDPQEVGPDGEQYFELPPGAWTVGVSAPELGLQVREVSVEAAQTSLIVINAVLREEEGRAVLVLTLTDPDGNPIQGALVAIDGEPVGTTANGGTLRIEGLAPSPSSLEVAGSMYEYTAVSPLELEEGPNDVDLVLQWLAGTVNVTATGPDGAPVDALVRAYGPLVLPPVRVGDDGTRVLYLEPGDWTVVASTEHMGIEQADVDVEPGQEALVEVNFALADAVVSETTLLLLVQDRDGNPIQGASVQFGDDTQDTPEGGSLLFDGPATGETAMTISATGYAPIEGETVDVVTGDQTRTYTLDWIDQPVQVRVQTDQGEPLQAEVTWTGPATVATGTTDAEGRITQSLRPGEWAVNVQAGDELGAGRVAFVIEPGQAPDEIVVELVDKRVTVTDDGEVQILEQVFFDTGRATIKPASYALLDEVAANLAFHPEITQVEIQGHTDNVGTDETNQKLSARRAAAVREYLVSKGVKRSVLVAEGYGASCPVESNETDAGRAANRRVQFVVLEQDGQPVELDSDVCRPE